MNKFDECKKVFLEEKLMTILYETDKIAVCNMGGLADYLFFKDTTFGSIIVNMKTKDVIANPKEFLRRYRNLYGGERTDSGRSIYLEELYPYVKDYVEKRKHNTNTDETYDNEWTKFVKQERGFEKRRKVYLAIIVALIFFGVASTFVNIFIDTIN